jgi:hypothetical protein
MAQKLIPPSRKIDVILKKGKIDGYLHKEIDYAKTV